MLLIGKPSISIRAIEKPWLALLVTRLGNSEAVEPLVLAMAWSRLWHLSPRRTQESRQSLRPGTGGALGALNGPIGTVGAVGAVGPVGGRL